LRGSRSFLGRLSDSGLLGRRHVDRRIRRRELRLDPSDRGGLFGRGRALLLGGLGLAPESLELLGFEE
jgi:hypothetical protein